MADQKKNDETVHEVIVGAIALVAGLIIGCYICGKSGTCPTCQTSSTSSSPCPDCPTIPLCGAGNPQALYITGPTTYSSSQNMVTAYPMTIYQGGVWEDGSTFNVLVDGRYATIALAGACITYPEGSTLGPGLTLQPGTYVLTVENASGTIVSNAITVTVS